MIFNNDIKDEFEKMAKHSGFIVMFDKVSVHAITPHRLVFSKNGDNLIVLYYDEYHEDDDLFFVDGEKYTLLTIKKYIRNYFKNNSNIKVK